MEDLQSFALPLGYAAEPSGIVYVREKRANDGIRTREYWIHRPAP